jgi:hypothetical protein
MKSTQPKAKLKARLPWVEDFSPNTVRFIGVVELLGAIGLILPAATGIAPILTRSRQPDWPSSWCLPPSRMCVARSRPGSRSTRCCSPSPHWWPGAGSARTAGDHHPLR